MDPKADCAAQTKPGFSLIELLVVMMLIIALSTMMMPYLLRRPHSIELGHITAEINGLAANAVQTAMFKNCLCRLTVEKRPVGGIFTVEEAVVVPQETKPKELLVGAGEIKTFKLADTGFASNRYELPSSVSIEHLQVKHRTESDEKANLYRCYVMPRGVAQTMELVLAKTDGGRITLSMNPFTGRFETVSKERDR